MASAACWAQRRRSYSSAELDDLNRLLRSARTLDGTLVQDLLHALEQLTGKSGVGAYPSACIDASSSVLVAAGLLAGPHAVRFTNAGTYCDARDVAQRAGDSRTHLR